MSRLARTLAHVALVLPMLAGACRKDKEEAAAPASDLVPRRVPDTNLVVLLPRGWLADMPDPGRLPPPPPEGAKLALSGRKLLEARPGTPAPGMLITPVLHVFEDPWLPLGSTGVDYLVAQRATNQAALGSSIRHVEAEPGRRAGRPSYHVRDEWTVLGPTGQSRDVSQEALLLLESVTTPDKRHSLTGYTIVITLEKAELKALQPVIREMLAGVRFEERTK
ncbi:MAG: hypothetical protein A2138_12465 [Deltaproteobacteria bacterium RBG_16_71_12]|nr:MAG: hypothetical protein A2138_12465 [Deltaproteobacteria bacterium RBG_16_71_12]